MHIIFECADTVYQKLSKSVMLVEVTDCESWHVFWDTV